MLHGWHCSRMRFLLDKVKTLKIGWNERPLTDEDFQRICRRLNVTVEEMPLRVGGFYYRVKGRDYIVIDSRLTGIAKRMVQFHELGHLLFHVPASGVTANFHGFGHKTRVEREADLFAVCAVLPRPMIETHSLAELIDDGIPADTVAERLQILADHGI